MALTQFAYRTQKSIGLTEGFPEYESLSGFGKPEGALRCCVYSPDGRYFAYAAAENVTIVDANTGSVDLVLPVPAIEIAFSPRGSFITTWERPSKLEDGNAAKNLKVWRTDNGEQTVAFVQKNQSASSIQYTFDEKYCARSVTNEIAFYETANMNAVWEHLRVEGVTEFQLSPGENYHVVVFVPEKKGHPAKAAVYSVPNFATPLMQKSFFKADKIQFNWNNAGTAVLFLTQTEVDKTGKNYYGETNLYMMNVKAGMDARVTLDKDGPISDLMWSPNGQEFCVVYGFMPAKTTIFDLKANPGQMDIYDRINGMRKLATFEASNATVCRWSPDGKHVLTATTSPRLRVDNGVKIWYALTGDLMYTEEMTELYEIVWRPQDVSKHPLGATLPAAPIPHASAVGHKSATPAKPAGAYRPPHARGSATPLHFKREDEGGAAHIAGSSVSFGNGHSDGVNGFKHRKREIPGAAPAVPGAAPGGGVSLDGTGVGGDKGEAGLSKSALKNKKKREAAKKAKEAQAAEQTAAGTEGQGDGQPHANGHMLAPGSAPNKGPRRDQSRTRSRSRGPPRPGPAGGNGNGNGHHRDGSGSLGQAFRDNYPRHRSPAPGGNHPQRQRSQRKKRDDGGNPVQSEQGGPAAAAAPLSPQDNGVQQQQPSRLHLPVPPPEVEITSPITPVTPGGGSGTPEEKKQRSLLKKLRAIEELKMRFAAGDKLEDTQIKKINTEESVRKELQGLGWKG
ncbi:Eukaryotic translation initiation factor [Drechslerella dactyloides]|uniref:Eukaryotic translation initiation factor 2A n=1 Tax=Drechslerella dactyloides TaxID=74499 RepID=A0AAD6IZS8_DREDA|nr:Eukaryotic translation initiation factor [Drechslerella dactyloides]